jgi:hypothetical protein
LHQVLQQGNGAFMRDFKKRERQLQKNKPRLKKHKDELTIEEKILSQINRDVLEFPYVITDEYNVIDDLDCKNFDTSKHRVTMRKMANE